MGNQSSKKPIFDAPKDTEKVMRTPEAISLTSDTFREVISGLSDINQQVMKFLLNCDEDMWKDRELRELVKEYYNTNLETVEFCATLQKYVWSTRDRLLNIKVAIQSEEEQEVVGCKECFFFVFLCEMGGKKYSRTLKALENFKAAGDPFSKEVVSSYNSVYEKIASLADKMEKVNKSKSSQAWQMVRDVLHAAAVVTKALLSVAAAVPWTPPIVKDWAAALPAPVDIATKWADSILETHNKKLKSQSDVVSSMHSCTCCTMEQLMTIQKLVDLLVHQIKSYLNNADLALTNENAVKPVIDEIKKHLSEFGEDLDNLNELAVEYSRSTEKGMQAIWDKINHEAAK